MEVTRAKQGMNRAGLLNTSMAVGEAEKARYQHALPIAQQDAQAALQAKLANQAEAGRAGEFTASQANIASRELAGIKAQEDRDILLQQQRMDTLQASADIEEDRDVLLAGQQE